MNNPVDIVGKTPQFHASLAEVPEFMSHNCLKFTDIDTVDYPARSPGSCERAGTCSRNWIIKYTGIDVRRDIDLFGKGVLVSAVRRRMKANSCGCSCSVTSTRPGFSSFETANMNFTRNTITEIPTPMSPIPINSVINLGMAMMIQIPP